MDDEVGAISGALPLTGSGSRPTDEAAISVASSPQAASIPNAGVTVVWDPLAATSSLFNRLFPTTTVQVAFLPVDECVSDGGVPVDGFTLFPDDGAPPEVYISEATPVLGLIDVLVHEFAHVVAGAEADHGPEWQRVHDQMWFWIDRGANPNSGDAE